MKRKIIYIIDNLNVGGAQRHLVRLVKGLRSRGVRAVVISLGSPKDTLVPELDKEWVVCLDMRSVWRLKFWSGYFKLIKLLKTERPQIVHTYLNTSNVFGVLAARRAKVPVILNSRRDMGHFRTGFIARLERACNKHVKKVVCVSNAVRQKTIDTEKLHPLKAAVLYSGVDPQEFQVQDKPYDPNRPLKIGMVAMMDRKVKGHWDFIKAAETVLKERKDVRFILIGDGRLRSSLESRVKAKGLKKYIEFKGATSDVKKEIREMDLFVMPSHSEGFSNAVLEAMAMGVPVLAYGLEGNLEIITNGKNGFLAEPGNSQNLAEKMLYIAGKRHQLEEIGQKARTRVLTNFTLDHMVERYRLFYADCSVDILKKERIGYIVSLFPCWSETFILNEIVELDKAGLDVTIFSIRNDLENYTQERAKRFLPKTRYIHSWGMLKAVLVWSLKKPHVIFPLLVKVIFQRYSKGMIRVKNVWSVWVACYFAGMAVREKLVHLHAHFATYPALVAMTISRLAGIPFTFTTHAHDIFLDKALLKDKIKAAKAVATISGYNKNYLLNLCGEALGSKIKGYPLRPEFKGVAAEALPRRPCEEYYYLCRASNAYERI